MARFAFSIGMIIWIAIGCKGKKDPEKEWAQYADRMVNEWEGKKMTLPADLPIVFPDSSSRLFDKTFTKPLKVVTFVDGTCGVCIDNLKHWQKFIDYVKKHNGQCDFIFYIQADDQEEFEKGIMTKLELKFPWILDKKDRFIFQNNLIDKRFQTALLNSKNEVMLIGDIMFNPKLEELYRKTIEEKSVDQTSVSTVR
jgi:hypothetical protein